MGSQSGCSVCLSFSVCAEAGDQQTVLVPRASLSHQFMMRTSRNMTHRIWNGPFQITCMYSTRFHSLAASLDCGAGGRDGVTRCDSNTPLFVCACGLVWPWPCRGPAVVYWTHSTVARSPSQGYWMLSVRSTASLGLQRHNKRVRPIAKQR
jgi:hypothetical protein